MVDFGKRVYVLEGMFISDLVYERVPQLEILGGAYLFLCLLLHLADQ